MTTIPIAAPAAEPLTLAEVKAHLRIEGAAEDDYLLGLIRVARAHLERSTGLCLITQSFRLVLESVSEDRVIQLLKGPVQAIDAIRVYDGAGTPRALSVPLLALDREGPPVRLRLPASLDLPMAENGIEIEFTAGFGASGAEVPDSLKRAMLLHVARMFDYRGAVTLDNQPAVLPDGYERLVQPFLGMHL